MYLNGPVWPRNPAFLPSVIGQELVQPVGDVMVAESCRVAFTNRQWEAYQFVLKFHRARDRAPTAAELGVGLGIALAESAKLIGALTSKGILQRRVCHVLAIVPPNYLRQELAEA